MTSCRVSQTTFFNSPIVSLMNLNLGLLRLPVVLRDVIALTHHLPFLVYKE